MLERIRSILNPDRYHGRGAGRPFFEGWYYKLVDRERNRRFAVIPGVFRGREPGKDHAFVQVLDGVGGRVEYYPYPLDAFSAASDRFAIRIGPNRFSANRIDLDIQGQARTLSGSLAFKGVTPWPRSLLSPGIMGWYAWVPFMECYHGVVSLDHTVEGSLRFDGETIEFTGGRGYTEKDWGRSFPAAWVWCQSNHFAEPGTSFTASVAAIPWLRGAFPGFIIGLWHRGRLYRFATYTGAKLELLEIGEHVVDWAVADKHYRLRMRLERTTGSLIQAPTTLDMDRRIAESLTATAQVELTPVGNGNAPPLFAGTGSEAGLEVAGDLPRLLAMYAKARRAGSGRGDVPSRGG